MTLRVLSFKFGAAAPFEIAKRHLRLYDTLARTFFGNSAKITAPPKVIPVPAEHSLSEFAFEELLNTEALTDADANVLIDLGGPDEIDSVRHNIVRGLTLALAAFEARKSKFAVGIFFANAMEEDAFFASRLKTLAINPRVRFLFGNGKSWGSYFDDHPPVRKDVIGALEQAKTTPIEMLERKLIRRVGFYQLPKSRQKLVHFYDGQSATGEIYQILVQEIRKRNKTGRFNSIAFDASHSKWFEEPVRRAALQTDLPAIAIDPSATNLPEYLSEHTLFVLPIVRTGRSIQRFTELYSARVGPAARGPVFWSLLSTEGDKPRGGRRCIGSDGEAPAIDFAYALRVMTTSEQLVSACANTEAKLLDPEEEEFAGQFGADAFWSMVLEAGILPETPVPATRASLGFVPDFGALSAFNGPFIAAKIEATLKRNFGYQIAPQLAFLCPDEPHARQLAKALHALAGHDTIFVDREILNRCSEWPLRPVAQRGDPPQFKSALHDLNAKLRRIGELTRSLPQHDRPHVVLLDEFNYSGGTMRSLFNLASAFSLRILCSISLASLSSDATKNSAVTAFSLYDLPYPASGGRDVAEASTG